MPGFDFSHAIPYTYDTTLPANPSNGQEAILTDSVTNPTYTWRLRYNAGSSSAYKWEFIGGSPLYTSTGTVSAAIGVVNTWKDITGTDIVVPRNGEYFCLVGGRLGLTTGSGNQQSHIGVADVSVNTNPLGLFVSLVVITYDSAAVETSFVGVAGHTLRPTIQSASANMGVWDRWLRLIPKRIS